MLSIKIQLQRPNFLLDVDCEIKQRVTAIFGASGSGKSTLLNTIAGITKPDHGKIILNNHCLFDSAKEVNQAIHQRKIGLVFQDAKLFPHLSIQKNLEYGIKDKKVAQKQHFDDLVDLLEIKPLLQQKPHALSGGEKQRVALGRALLSNPQLLMLDEPLASLDARLKQQILPFLATVAQEINIPMLYVSHDPMEIAQITEHVVHINHGKLKTNE